MSALPPTLTSENRIATSSSLATDQLDMKPLNIIGNILLWFLVCALLLLGIASALQPYRFSRLLENVVALAGPSLSQATPLKGTLVRIPLRVERCADVPWVKTLVSSNAITVDGLCNIRVAPDQSQHVLMIHNGQIYTGPADCRDIADSSNPHEIPARYTGHFCVYSSYLKRSEDFGATGDGNVARASVLYAFSDLTPFAKVDSRLLYSNPLYSGDRVPMSTLPPGGEAHTNDQMELRHRSWFAWRLVKREFNFVHSVQ